MRFYELPESWLIVEEDGTLAIQRRTGSHKSIVPELRFASLRLFFQCYKVVNFHVIFTLRIVIGSDVAIQSVVCCGWQLKPENLQLPQVSFCSLKLLLSE